MADRPDSNQDSQGTTGGWRRPANAAPVPARPKPAETGAWKTPTLPKDMTQQPRKQGGWHLPRPEDALGGTGPLKPVVETPPPKSDSARPEDSMFEMSAEAPAEPAVTSEDSSLLALETKTKEEEASGSLLNLEQVEAVASSQPLEELDDEEDGGFSMSELIALSSLVENKPAPAIKPVEKPAESAAAPAAAGTDPGEYARRQLEALQGGTGPQPAVSSTGSSGVGAAEDPGAYARRQLEALSGSQPMSPVADLSSTGAGAATGAMPAAADSELARKFRETEAQVRELRALNLSGQISRDELQQRLRQLMILDDSRVWWMMGMETDTWYKFDNGDWTVATPPFGTSTTGLPVSGMAGSPATLTGAFDPNLLPKAPFPDSQPIYPGQAGFTSTIQDAEQYSTPLPQPVPIYDANATLVGNAGAYLSPVRPSDAQTLDSYGQAQPTVVSPAVNFPPSTSDSGWVSVQSPIPQTPVDTTPPTYDIAKDAPFAQQIQEEARARTVSNAFRLVLVGLAALLLLGACGIGFVVMQYQNIANQYAPAINGLKNFRPEFQTVRILDVNGDLITELNSQQGGARTTVPLSQISPFMIHAVVSLENERFFEDPGWDYVAIGRAFLQNIAAGQVESGASTITQQIAEQLVLGQPTTTTDLKLRELIIASQIAQQYTKEEILGLYLNQIFFGNQSYGVEAAAQFYFGHSANDLTLPEAAMLAGMIGAPATYNPVRTPQDTFADYGSRRDAVFARMEDVIRKMQQVSCLPIPHPEVSGQFCVDAAAVNAARIQTAQVKTLTFQPREVRFRYAHFVEMVRSQVNTAFGEGVMFQRGFVIRTTLNPAVQDIAEAALRQTVTSLSTAGINTGSVMVTDPRNGAVRAMVGSPDFNNDAIDGQVNGAITYQQPGSSIKPILYAAAFESFDNDGNGTLEYLTPATILWDVPTTFQNPTYQPRNFDNNFWGPLSIRTALQNSRNIPAVKAYEFVGSTHFRQVAERLGLTFLPEAQFGLPSGLGATETRLYDMMMAYGTMANNGVRSNLYLIESITDLDGNPVELPQRAAPSQQISPQVAYLLQNILSDDQSRAQEFGLNGPLTIQGLPTRDYVAAKTGTTDGTRDLWTMGFTHNVVVGVWLGRPDNNPTNVQGGGYRNVAPLWNQVMLAALGAAGRPDPFTPPVDGSIIQQQVCSDTGTLPPSNCTSLRTELFIANQPPPGADQAFVQQVDVDSWTGLRANQFCPNNRIAGTFINITDQSALAWLNSAAGSQVAQRLGIGGRTLEQPPAAECTVNTEVPIVGIVAPGEGQQVSGVLTVTGAASAGSFNRFQLEVASASAPTNFQIVFGPVTAPQTSGQLGSWNTASVPNGTYILRLWMVSNSGGYASRTVTVSVNNAAPLVAPTATFGSFTVPTLPAGTSIFAPSPTPNIPFAEVTPLPPGT
ncbi:MAG TPA: transglycosylase domain-containing protein [Aggregatilineales bacterium]|nr:transglycosylase domain-containing protein [Aggregatilineales bacterium]